VGTSASAADVDPIRRAYTPTPAYEAQAASGEGGATVSTGMSSLGGGISFAAPGMNAGIASSASSGLANSGSYRNGIDIPPLGSSRTPISALPVTTVQSVASALSPTAAPTSVASAASPAASLHSPSAAPVPMPLSPGAPSLQPMTPMCGPGKRTISPLRYVSMTQDPSGHQVTGSPIGRPQMQQWSQVAPGPLLSFLGQPHQYNQQSRPDTSPLGRRPAVSPGPGGSPASSPGPPSLASRYAGTSDHGFHSGAVMHGLPGGQSGAQRSRQLLASAVQHPGRSPAASPAASPARSPAPSASPRPSPSPRPMPRPMPSGSPGPSHHLATNFSGVGAHMMPNRRLDGLPLRLASSGEMGCMGPYATGGIQGMQRALPPLSAMTSTPGTPVPMLAWVPPVSMDSSQAQNALGVFRLQSARLPSMAGR